ncbi:MAG: hypothetical protein AAF556_06705 [Pseudomonadota bacterium]
MFSGLLTRNTAETAALELIGMTMKVHPHKDGRIWMGHSKTPDRDVAKLVQKIDRGLRQNRGADNPLDPEIQDFLVRGRDILKPFAARNSSAHLQEAYSYNHGTSYMRTVSHGWRQSLSKALDAIGPTATKLFAEHYANDVHANAAPRFSLWGQAAAKEDLGLRIWERARDAGDVPPFNAPVTAATARIATP